MQSLLQDVTEYLPLVGGLSPALRRDLQQHLVPLLPIIIGVAISFIVVSGAVLLKVVATAAFIPLFLMIFSPFLMLLSDRKSDSGTASIEFGKLKVSWQGGLAFGFLVAGLLLLLLVYWVKA